MPHCDCKWFSIEDEADMAWGKLGMFGANPRVASPGFGGKWGAWE